MFATQLEATLHWVLVCGSINKIFLATFLFLISSNRQRFWTECCDGLLPAVKMIIWVHYNQGLIFIVLAIISICYDYILKYDLVTLCIITTKCDRARNEQSDNNRGCKQTNSVVRLSKPLYLELKPKISAPVMLVVIPHCKEKPRSRL